MDPRKKTFCFYPPTSPFPLVVYLLLLVLSAPLIPAAEESLFNISLQLKTNEHPYYGLGSNYGYSINGSEGATLRIVRGGKYKFRIDDTNYSTCGQPFTLASDQTSSVCIIYQDIYEIIAP